MGECGGSTVSSKDPYSMTAKLGRCIIICKLQDICIIKEKTLKYSSELVKEAAPAIIKDCQNSIWTKEQEQQEEQVAGK